MKKIKKLWVENRVLLVLFVIVIICFFVILGVFISYFFGSSKSSYGDRLDGIEKVQVTEEIKNKFLESLSEDGTIIDKSIETKGKIIYIRLLFSEEVSLVEAQSKALASLDYFEEDYKNFYDFNYTIKQDATETTEGFLLMGAKNVNGSGLVWNNNTKIEESEE